MAMLRVRTVFTGKPGTPYLNTTFWIGDANTTSAQKAVDAMRDFWTTCNGVMQSGLAWTVQGDVAVINPIGGDLTSVVTVTPRSGVGANNADPLPPANQILVRLTTSAVVGGRVLKGHFNIPSPCEDNNTGGTVGATTITLLNPALATLNAVTAPDLSVWSRTFNQAASVDAMAIAPGFSVLRSRRD
jgi:hypothetical protein